MVDPATVGASLSIFASLMTIIASVRQMMAGGTVSSEEAIQNYLREANPEEREILSDPDMRLAIGQLTVISDRLLDQLGREASTCEERHVQARRSAQHQIDKDQADVDAGSCMCNVLRDLQRYNSRQLPDHGPFKGWWEQYSCKL